MAPRRRVQKSGFRRIDAALDALRPMGFKDKVVRRTIANLLKAYGGDDGWVFIEEGYYKLVIDTLIDEQANAEQKLLIERCSQKDVQEEDQCAVQADFSPPLDLHCSFSPEIHSVIIHSSHKNSLPPVDIVPYSSKHQNSGGMIETQFFSPQISSAEPCTLHPHVPSISMQRKLCYGWISSDDEGDFVC